MHELRRRRKQIVASRPDTWTSLLPNNPFRLYEFKEGDAQSRFTIMKSARVKVDLIDDAYAGPSLESLRNSKPSVFPFKSSENCAPRKFNACLSTINLSRKAYLEVVFCFNMVFNGSVVRDDIIAKNIFWMNPLWWWRSFIENDWNFMARETVK